ncbi:VOC family protein [Metabacillus arenae]|uniref:VOC family protein n=1 Tax=Metabacillus arenae TaxID=2771434 RepID=A0A926NF96_9BACI|nr:VOC family protein [Metabacillus arenae]MBD1379423.1 VOC family protein [Metabacillus arenae]
MKPKINIITLAVDDLAKSIAFYKDGLGLPTKGIVDGEDHILFEMQGNLSLVLILRTEFNKVANQPNTSNKSSEFILSYTADSKEEVDSILKKTTAAGGTLLSNQPKDYDWGYSGHFKDPDGHIWEIVYFYE